jgi:hypothetical protein
MMGKIWESIIWKRKKPLYFSGLPRKCAALAGERLRPLGHISVDPFSDCATALQAPFALSLMRYAVDRSLQVDAALTGRQSIISITLTAWTGKPQGATA